MKILERNGARALPWAFDGPLHRMGTVRFSGQSWKRYNVRPTVARIAG